MTKENEINFDIEEIMKLLPHRYPMLLVDRVLDINLEEHTIETLKNVTINEDFFNGHFPQKRVMPGVLIVESVAQSAAIFTFNKHKNLKSVYLLSINSAKFRKMVIPGDTIIHKIKQTKERKGIFVCESKSFVNGEVVCECNITGMLTE